MKVTELFGSSLVCYPLFSRTLGHIFCVSSVHETFRMFANMGCHSCIWKAIRPRRKNEAVLGVSDWKFEFVKVSDQIELVIFFFEYHFSFVRSKVSVTKSWSEILLHQARSSTKIISQLHNSTKFILIDPPLKLHYSRTRGSCCLKFPSPSQENVEQIVSKISKMFRNKHDEWRELGWGKISCEYVLEYGFECSINKSHLHNWVIFRDFSDSHRSQDNFATYKISSAPKSNFGFKKKQNMCCCSPLSPQQMLWKSHKNRMTVNLGLPLFCFMSSRRVGLTDTLWPLMTKNPTKSPSLRKPFFTHPITVRLAIWVSTATNTLNKWYCVCEFVWEGIYWFWIFVWSWTFWVVWWFGGLVWWVVGCEPFGCCVWWSVFEMIRLVFFLNFLFREKRVTIWPASARRRGKKADDHFHT